MALSGGAERSGSRPPGLSVRGLLILLAGGASIAVVGGLWTAWWTVVSPWIGVGSGFVAVGVGAAAYAVFRWARVASPAVNAAAGLLLVVATLGTAHYTAWRVFADDLYARVQGGSLDDYLARHGVDAWRELGADDLAGAYLGYVFDLGHPGGYFTYLRLRADDGYDVLMGTRYSGLLPRHREGAVVWLDLAIDTAVIAWGILTGVTWACWTGVPPWFPLGRRRRNTRPGTTGAVRR